MSYRVKRGLGFQRWGVTNPWVFANYGQPQRHRGYVSPMVMQTSGPFLKTAHLGAEGPPTDEQSELKRARDRARRMERYALAGMVMSGFGLFMAHNFYSSQPSPVKANRRRRTSRKRR